MTRLMAQQVEEGATERFHFAAGKKLVDGIWHNPLVDRILIVIFCAGIFLFDTFTQIDIAIAALYAVVVVFSAKTLPERDVLFVGAGAIGLTLASFFMTHAGDYQDEAVGRCVVACVVISASTLLAVIMQRAERGVREKAALLELTCDAIIVRDVRDGRDAISYWNAGAESLYGWTRAEVLGLRLQDLLHTRSTNLAAIPDELARTGYWQGELRHTCRDGSEVIVDSRWSLQRDAHGAPMAILQINADVTEQKRAEEALNKSRAELSHMTRVMTLGELASSIAHEVRQPIAAVVTDGDSCLRWLLRDVPDLLEVRACAERMIANARRTDQVVTRLRALATKDKAERTLFDINEIVSDILPLVERERLSRSVVLDLALDPDGMMVEADRIQLQQVLLNLVVNAIQAMSGFSDRQRLLSIRSSRQWRAEAGAECAIIEVRDTGPGIDADAVARLFTPFFTTKAQGMGMGLSISRSIVDAHGGWIGVTSDQGSGAIFTVAIPLHNAKKSSDGEVVSSVAAVHVDRAEEVVRF